MVLKELSEVLRDIIERSSNNGITFVQEEPPLYPGLNEFMESLGCTEFSLTGCRVIYQNSWGREVLQLEGSGRLLECDYAAAAVIDYSSEWGTQGIKTSAVFSYEGVRLGLQDICNLLPSLWNHGSVVALHDESVLCGTVLKDVQIQVDIAANCRIEALVDLRECMALRGKSEEFPLVYALEYPFDTPLIWSGIIKNPAGGKYAVGINMKSEYFKCSDPMPLLRRGREPMIIKYAYMQIQTHRLDEQLLNNYALEESEGVLYVSCADYGYVIEDRNTIGKKLCEIFYTVGTLGACAEFSSDGGYLSTLGCDDGFICYLLGCNGGSLMKVILDKIKKLMAGDAADTGNDINISCEVMERGVSACFRRVLDKGNIYFILDSIYFGMNMSIYMTYGNNYGGKWIVEGYLTGYNIENKDLENFELAATLYETSLRNLLPDNFEDGRGGIFRNVLAQIDASLSLINMETCYPLGEPYEPEPETDLGDFAEEFDELDFFSLVQHDNGLRDVHDLKVSYFKCEGNLEEQVFYAEITVDTSAVLYFNIGEFEVSLREITVYLNYTPQNMGVGLSGTLRMGFTDSETFDLFLSGSYESGHEGEKGIWSFEAGLLKGAILLSDIINRIMGWNLSFDMEVTAFRVTYTTRRTYSVLCAVSTRFPLFGGTIEISVMADVKKNNPQKDADVLLSGEVEIQYFLFAVQVHLYEDSRKEYQFTLQFDELLVTAVYEVPGIERLQGPILSPMEERDGGVLIVCLKNFTIGSLINALFKVLRPNENFKLPKPWDILNRIGFQEIKIVYHVDTGDIQVTLPVNIDLLLLTVEEVGFTYQNREGENEEKFNILINYHWLVPYIEAENDGESGFYLWDAFHSPAPGPVAESSRKMFYLKYFGIGRHIDLGISQTEDMTLSEILQICKKNVKEETSVPSDKYNADYGWFIGAQFTLLEFLDVSLLFYDPVIYGLHAVVLNNDVVPLKGLDLTIYYRKVTEDIGLFYINAGLPDIIKHMEFGMLSVTLPSIEVWIYTNGNFKVNFGFPSSGDFSKSFALSYGIFYGRGGFYFGYLNGDTSSGVPKTTEGCFDPVIELGIGFTIGVGKDFNFGILRLRAELGLTGIFEGVFAKFHSPDEKVQEMYYRCTGTVVIAGEISGEVNFFIIKAGFRIYARAALSASLESGEPTVLVVEASFGVSAYVKIWIFKISFHFSYTYRDTFQLGKAESKPWKKNMLSVDSKSFDYNWTPKKLYPEKLQLSALITPYYSKDCLKASWGSNDIRYQNEQGNEIEKIAFPAVMLETDFAKLAKVLLTFAIGAQNRPDPETVSLEQLRDILDELGDERCQAFTLENINELFNLNLVLKLEGSPCSINDSSIMRERLFGAVDENRVPVPFPPVYQVVWAVRRQGADKEEFDENVYDLNEIYEAKTIFEEYISLVVKTGIQRALEYVESGNLKGSCKKNSGDLELERIPVSELIFYLENHIGEIGGIVSRFLLHGNRREGRPLYDVIRQQFTGITKAGWKDDDIVHRLKLSKAGRELIWAGSDEVVMSVAAGDLDYPQERLNIRFISGPSKLPADTLEPGAAALSDRQAVYYNDEPQFFLWKMPEEIRVLEDLQIRAWPMGRLPDDKEEESLDYCCTVLLDITLRRGQDDENIYDIVSASEETRQFLRDLDREEKKGRIKSVKLLFSKDIKKSEENRPKGAYYYDDEERSKNTWLIRQNLSEITTVPQVMRLAGQDMQYCAKLGEEGADAFFKLLYQMLLIGGGGHYIRIGGGHLESELFSDDGQTVLYFLLETDSVRMANRILLYGDLDVSTVPVVDNDSLEKRCLSVIKPGKIGFEMAVAAADEEILQKNPYMLSTADERKALRNNLTSQAFTLLYYKADGMESLPISMQDTDKIQGGNVNYYSHIMDVPHYPSPVREIPDMINPYAGILPQGYERGQEVHLREIPITYYFADIMGNSIGSDYGYEPQNPIILTYTDSLIAVTELPMTQVSYKFLKGEKKEQFKVRLSIMSESGESVERIKARCASERNLLFGEQQDTINLEQFAAAYYQYAQQDVSFSLGVSFGDLYSDVVEWTNEEKEEVVGYLFKLYDYAKAIREGGEAVAPEPVMLEFVMDKREFQDGLSKLVVCRLSVSVIIKRDKRYVEKSGRLPNMDTIESEVGSDKDLKVVCAEFEQAFDGSKMLSGNGLYGAFFPKHALEIKAPAVNKLFFALRPVSTRLMSRTGMEFTKLSERLSGITAVYTAGYINIDIELWIRKFLGFYERILRPGNLDYLLAEDEEAGSVLNDLLQLKGKLAEEIAGSTESLFLDDSGAVSRMAEAENSLRDMMWKNLLNGYEAAGVASYSQTDKLGNFALNGELYGVAGVNGAKVVSGMSDICFQVSLEHVEESNTMSMEGAVLRFTHLEDQFSGSWYRFISPFEIIRDYVDVKLETYEDQMPVILPIPYRKYPVSPNLTFQKADIGNKEFGRLTWSYTVSMDASLTAQDKIYVIFSTRQLKPCQINDSEDDLFGCLAQFIYDESEYESYLIKPVTLNENDIRSRKEDIVSIPSNDIIAALKDFSGIARHITEKWNQNMYNEESEYGFNIRCKFEGQRMNRVYLLTDGQIYPEGLAYPVLTVTDKSGQSAQIALSGRSMYYEIPPNISIAPGDKAAYQFRIDDISIYQYQGFKSEIYLKRNEEFCILPKGSQPIVNPGFVYETKRTGFKEVIHPYIGMNEQYDAGEFSIDSVLGLLRNFICTDAMLQTELTLWLGQRIYGGHIVYRPLNKLIRHFLSEDTARGFLEKVSSEWEGMSLKGQGKYFVRLGIVQFLNGDGDDEGREIIVDADNIVYYL